LTAWRVVFQKLLFWQRKKGQNTRTAVIIGAPPPGYNLAMQIQPNDQLGIQFKGSFVHGDLNRLSHEFTGQITGNVEQVIALAFYTLLCSFLCGLIFFSFRFSIGFLLFSFLFLGLGSTSSRFRLLS
jgi:hypothetical protein